MADEPPIICSHIAVRQTEDGRVFECLRCGRDLHGVNLGERVRAAHDEHIAEAAMLADLYELPCRKCQGTGAVVGFVVDRPCPKCDGTGRVGP